MKKVKHKSNNHNNIIFFFSLLILIVYSKLYIYINYVLMVNIILIERVDDMIACKHSLTHTHTHVIMYTPSTLTIQISKQTCFFSYINQKSMD